MKRCSQDVKYKFPKRVVTVSDNIACKANVAILFQQTMLYDVGFSSVFI